MKHASDFLRRPVPRRYPWRKWAINAAYMIAFTIWIIVAAVGLYLLLVFGLAL